MKRKKPIASLSLDLDNKWSYLMTHGEPGWKSFPSYLDVLVPRVLNFLKTWNLNITFFIVGQDAALEENRELLKSIAKDDEKTHSQSLHTPESAFRASGHLDGRFRPFGPRGRFCAAWDLL